MGSGRGMDRCWGRVFKREYKMPPTEEGWSGVSTVNPLLLEVKTPPPVVAVAAAVEEEEEEDAAPPSRSICVL
jgi:hypothetical protein